MRTSQVNDFQLVNMLESGPNMWATQRWEATRNPERQEKLSPGASVPLSPLSPTLAYTVTSVSRNQEGKGNRRGKERPRIGQSLVRRGSHLILRQGETIRMLKGRKERERRESLERKDRDAIKCRGRTILDGGFGPSAFWFSPAAHFVGSLSTEKTGWGSTNPPNFPVLPANQPSHADPHIFTSSFSSCLLPPQHHLSACPQHSPMQPRPSGPLPLSGILWLAAQEALQSL